jgi:hypothetical protein
MPNSSSHFNIETSEAKNQSGEKIITKILKIKGSIQRRRKY